MPQAEGEARTGRICVNAHENRYLREAINLLLASLFPTLRIADAADNNLLMRRTRELNADLIVLSYYGASGNNFELIAGLRSAGCHAPIVVVCDFVEDVIVARAVEYGVRAFIYEGALYTDMRPALNAVLEGGTFLSKF